jgi:mono/diheme cytochrome c family protein
VTEIPEHLLKRAAERRAAMTGGAAPDDAPAAAPAAAGDAPAPAAAAGGPPAKKPPAPLPTLDVEPARAVPEIPVVAAARRRKRVPYWAAPVLALMPLWGMIYYYSVQPPPAGENDPLVIGKEVYAKNCAGCHLPTGAGASAGGSGQQLSDGHVLATFPDPLDQAHWIRFGAAGGARDNGTYGDPKRPGGAMNVDTLSGIMPAFAQLSDEELAAVVIYIRQELSGGNPKDDPNFNVETFTASPTAAEAAVKAVTDLGPGGDPDTKSIDGAETN